MSIYIKPYAQQWFEIGLLLGISVHKLADIEEHFKNDVQSCAARVLTEWTLSNDSACWEKLWEVVENTSKNANIKPSTELGTTYVCVRLNL